MTTVWPLSRMTQDAVDIGHLLGRMVTHHIPAYSVPLVLRRAFFPTRE
jgi:hypothetical protein